MIIMSKLGYVFLCYFIGIFLILWRINFRIYRRVGLGLRGVGFVLQFYYWDLFLRGGKGELVQGYLRLLKLIFFIYVLVVGVIFYIGNLYFEGGLLRWKGKVGFVDFCGGCGCQEVWGMGDLVVFLQSIFKIVQFKRQYWGVLCQEQEFDGMWYFVFFLDLF